MSGNILDPVTTNRYYSIQAYHAGIPMTADITIFGLRFRSNEKLQPSIDGLRIFLDSPQKDDKGKRHGDDLGAYRDLLKAVESFEHGQQTSFHDRMLFTVLSHSHLVKTALKSAVEQYKYHMQNLSELDLKKPSAFIKSAEEEITRLNPKKKDEAARKERLMVMIEERKRVLDALKKHWLALAEELSHIIAYIRDNLTKIEKLSEESIVILVGDQISRKKEIDLIEDIKTQFKERLRESLHQGTITKEQLEAAKEEVAGLSKRTADLMRADVYTLTQLYEAIHEYSGRASRDLDRMLSEIEGRKHTNFEKDLELYAQVEKILILFTHGCRFEIKTTDIGTETEHDRILVEKRKEMLDYLFNLLRKGSS
jgi:methyl-accepting chemotaxis protein